jgi:uncharacterized protein with HEPN domain
MMRPTSFKLLRDVLAAADSISRATAGLTFDDYQRVELLQAGVERWFEKIGEALRRLEQTDPDTAAKIPDLRDVVDFRNLLAHGYAMVRETTSGDMQLNAYRRLACESRPCWRRPPIR